LCRFLGITIAIFFEKNAQHHRPHVHAFYGDSAATYAIDDGTLLGGKLSVPANRAVREFIKRRRPQLHAAWEAAVHHKTPQKIEPLKVK